MKMHHLSSNSPTSAERRVNGINKISLLLTTLAIAIVVFAIMPIILHHSVDVRPTNNAPHQLMHQLRRATITSSKRNGKTSTIETVKYQLNDEEVFNFAYEDEHMRDIPPLPPDISGSGRFLLLNALEKRSIWDDELDSDIETERCRKYFSYTDGVKHFSDYKGRKRRRLFLGSLIADDSWHALGALAMETYGVYTAVAFVESNRTQTGTPRELRFVNGTVDHTILMESNLFGPNTTVMLDYFSFEGKLDAGHLVREQMQRSLIIDMWKRAGMTPDDIGVITDADETPTRDMLRAAQTCDFPHLNHDTQNCHTAKLIVSSMVFEGSPECMTVTRDWMHPDLILGKCIEGIGDDEFKLDDTQRQRKFAWRKKPYTHKFGNYSGWPKEKTTFPLWNAADFRRDQGGHVIMWEHVDYLKNGFGHTGYHFHNYFGTTQQLRQKYMTYGHPVEEAANMSVAEMHPDLDTMVDCVLGRSTAHNKFNTLSTKLEEFDGRIPIAYGIEGYNMARHMELKAILMEDHAKGYNKTWHQNPKSVDWYEKIPK